MAPTILQRRSNGSTNDRMTMLHDNAVGDTCKKRAMRATRCLVWTLLSTHHGFQRKSIHAFSSCFSTLTTHRFPPTNTPSSQSTTQSLPQLYPPFATILQRNGYITPTPIQKSSSPRAKNGENLLLIAATGSGKTLAYLLPALSRIVSPSSTTKRRRTCLVVAPTRELAAQLARDASSLLLPTNNNSVNTDDDHDEFPPVLLAVRGIPPPTPAQLTHATLLVGTPEELYAVLTRIAGAHHFISGETLDSIVLDEVDVLLPLPPKTLRTSFDGTRRNNKDDDEQRRRQRERMTLEQRRKYRAAQRRGMEFHNASPPSNENDNTPSGVVNGSSSPMVLSPTERILRLVASFRFVGGRESSTTEDDEEEGGRRRNCKSWREVPPPVDRRSID
eukprot:CCRYP_007656-RB/>CCRYP_007656-RB protein AED:0.33 eAED:0.33 QI:0/0/0/1/1/1/2/0/388